MGRVFVTGSYKRPREANWLIGLGLLAITLGLVFTGTVLKWDQEGFEALGHNVEIGNLLGAFGFWFSPEFTPSLPDRRAALHGPHRDPARPRRAPPDRALPARQAPRHLGAPGPGGRRARRRSDPGPGRLHLHRPSCADGRLRAPDARRGDDPLARLAGRPRAAPHPRRRGHEAAVDVPALLPLRGLVRAAGAAVGPGDHCSGPSPLVPFLDRNPYRSSRRRRVFIALGAIAAVAAVALVLYALVTVPQAHIQEAK